MNRIKSYESPTSLAPSDPAQPTSLCANSPQIAGSHIFLGPAAVQHLLELLAAVGEHGDAAHRVHVGAQELQMPGRDVTPGVLPGWKGTVRPCGRPPWSRCRPSGGATPLVGSHASCADSVVSHLENETRLLCEDRP